VPAQCRRRQRGLLARKHLKEIEVAAVNPKSSTEGTAKP